MSQVKSKQLLKPIEGSFSGSFSGSFYGNLEGTSSFSLSSSHSDFSNSSSYSSFSLSSSHADTATTASYVFIPEPKIRYNIATYSGNILTNIFSPGSETAGHNYNPNYNNINNILPYINYLYVDIYDTNNNITYKEMSFSDQTDIQNFLNNNNIEGGRIILYSYKNDTANLKVGGANQLSTMTSYKHATGKITSNKSYQVYPDIGRTGLNLINDYLLNRFITNLFPFLYTYTDYIPQIDIDNLVNSESLKFMNVHKYDERKLKSFYIHTPTVSIGGVNTISSNRTKLMLTCLMKLDYGGPSIEMIHASRTYPTRAPITKRTLYENEGYFNIYVLQDVVNDGWSLAIEFLSIDAVILPYTTTIRANVCFLKKKNTLRLITSTKANNFTYVDFLPLNAINYDRSSFMSEYSNTLDVFRIYDDKTCDVFDDCLKVVNSKYFGSDNGNNSIKQYYFKLNKK